MADRPHSEEWFGDQRDHWWNADFLDLMARRWDLRSVRSLLDVGCGIGHWSRLLFPRLGAGATLVGIDREPRWVAEASAQFRRAFGHVGAEQAHFIRADAVALPFADGTFDGVTCQTVLMHLAEPMAALREMARVVKPGGLVVAVEPNNLFNCLDWSDNTSRRPPHEIAEVFQLWLTYQRGKDALGEGDSSLGERLPGMFQRVGLADIQTHMGDRAIPLLPPYDRADQRAMLAASRSWKERGRGPWDEVELRAKFDAAGGSPELFDRALGHLRRWWDEDQASLDEGTFRSAGGSSVFLVAGRKPGDRRLPSG